MFQVDKVYELHNSLGKKEFSFVDATVPVVDFIDGTRNMDRP